MREPYRIDIRLSVPCAAPRWLLTGALLLACANELGSESVTLTTYYPAPSGVYAQLLTTGVTRLARDSDAVMVGPGTPAGGTKLAVMGGNVGIGTVSPAGGTQLAVMGGNVGIGTASPAAAYGLQIVGKASIISTDPNVHRYLHISNVGAVGKLCNSDSSGVTITQGAVCGNTEYATFVPGLYVEGWWHQARGNQVLVEAGPGQTSTQVRGLHPVTGAEAWMTLKKDDSQSRIYCCPR